jgi:hypothetical protein
VRFAASHKTTTYLAVACAYLALALSGELGPLAIAGGGVGAVASWWFEAPRVRVARWQGWLTVVVAALFAWSVLQLLLGGDILLLGAEFLLVLQIAKLFSRQALKDYLQIHVLSFLMLAAGTVLNSGLTFGLCFLGYVVFATWAMMLQLLRRELEDHHLVRPAADAPPPLARALASRRIVDGRFFAGSALVSLGVFASAATMFVLIPRIGFGLFVSKSRDGVAMAGFSDGVKLGGHGLIRSDATVVMRVKLAGGGRDAPSLHWRGVAFDRYHQGAWSRSAAAPRTRTIATVGAQTETYHLLDDGPPPLPEAMIAREARAMRQEIYLEPLGYDVLFGASRPLAFELSGGPQPWRRAQRNALARKRQQNDEFRHEHTAGMRYVVYSAPEPPSPAALRRAPDRVPLDHEVYLAVPDEVTERVRAKARELTAGLTNDYDRIVALERWLKTELDYTLEQRAPAPGQDPIDFFLFDRKMGHCEYFGSALAIMGRVVGVPTRSVNGFLGGEWNEFDEYVAVRAGDAHSWVEAYFPGQGWVTFDPTPAAEAQGLGRGGEGVLDRLNRMADTLRFKWFKWVIEYDLGSQMSLFKSLGGALRGDTSKAVKRKTEALKAWAKDHRGVLIGALGGMTAVVALVALRRRRRGEIAELLGGARRGPRATATAAYGRALHRLARRGHRRAPSQTPREHALALVRAEVPGAAALVELGELHYAAEYGTDSPAIAARALELEAAIGQALSAAGRRRRSD